MESLHVTKKTKEIGINAEVLHEETVTTPSGCKGLLQQDKNLIEFGNVAFAKQIFHGDHSSVVQIYATITVPL